VKIKAFGLNRMDLLQREGNYALPPQAPKTLGVEFSGVIESLGPKPDVDIEGVKKEDLKVGDEVFGLAYGGAYAEYISVSTHMLLHKPSHLSWIEAAGIPEVCDVSLSLFCSISSSSKRTSRPWLLLIDLNQALSSSLYCIFYFFRA
jgi:NADPH:quinone reductase-like Zn-dependent oxidoreductase